MASDDLANATMSYYLAKMGAATTGYDLVVGATRGCDLVAALGAAKGCDLAGTQRPRDAISRAAADTCSMGI